MKALVMEWLRREALIYTSRPVSMRELRAFWRRAIRQDRVVFLSHIFFLSLHMMVMDGAGPGLTGGINACAAILHVLMAANAWAVAIPDSKKRLREIEELCRREAAPFN